MATYASATSKYASTATTGKTAELRAASGQATGQRYVAPVSSSRSKQVLELKPGEVIRESDAQVKARRDAISSQGIDTNKINGVSSLGTVTFGPLSEKGAVEGEVERISRKYPGYVAPNASVQAQNIAAKMHPEVREAEKYPGWNGKQTDISGNLRALASAQEVGYYGQGEYASTAGRMPGSQMPVLKSLHERMGIPYGGGMSEEYIPESSLSVGFQNLFERRSQRLESSRTYTPFTQQILSVKGGSFKDIPYEQLNKAPSGTTFTITSTNYNIPTPSIKPNTTNTNETDPFDNVIKSSLIPNIGFGGILNNLPSIPEGTKLMEEPPKIYAPGIIPLEQITTETYNKPGIGSYLETGYIGAGFMLGFTGPLQVAAFKVGQYGINVGTALVGAASTIVGRVSKEATVKYYTPIAEKIESYIPTQLKEPAAATLLTAGYPGLNIAFYYADKMVYGGNLTPGQRAGKVTGDVAEAAGIITTATFLGPKLIPQMSLQTAANKLSLTTSKPYSDIPEVDSSGFMVSIRKGGNTPKILYDNTKISLNEQVVASEIAKPGLTQRVNPLVEESFLRSSKEVQLNTRFQSVPKNMIKELNIEQDVKAFKGEPEYARVMTEELKQNKDLTGFGGVSRVTHQASESTSDIDMFITSSRTSTSEAESLLSKFQNVKGSQVRINPESPSLIEKKVGKDYVHMVDIKGSDSPEIQSGIKLNKDFFPYGQPITFESVNVGGLNVRKLSVEGTALRGASTLPKAKGLTPFTPEETFIFETKFKGMYIEMGGTFEPASHRIKDVKNFYDIQQRLIEAGKVTGSKSTASDTLSIKNYAEAADFKFKGLIDNAGRRYNPILSYYSKTNIKPSVSPIIQAYGSTSIGSVLRVIPSRSVSSVSSFISFSPTVSQRLYVPSSRSVNNNKVYESPISSSVKSVSTYYPKAIPSSITYGNKITSTSLIKSITQYSPSPHMSIYVSPYSSTYRPSYPSSSLTSYLGYNSFGGGGGGVIWSSGGVLDGGRRKRGRSQRFVPAFVPSGDVLFDLFGDGRSVTKKRTKTKRRKRK
jgi:hypothetical protein